MSAPHVTMTENYSALLLAAQALFTRFNDPRMWDKIDTEDRNEWLGIAASMIGAWDANVRRPRRPPVKVTEEEYDALHDRLCACGTPASALSCPLAVGIVGERCCKGCPDCMGIGVREQLIAVQQASTLLAAAISDIDKEGGNVSASTWGTLLAVAESL